MKDARLYDITDFNSKQNLVMEVSALQTKGKPFLVMIIDDPEDIRTTKQNNALHKGLRMLGKAMSEAGVDKREFFKEPFFISWTMEDMKAMFKMIAKALHYPSTTTKMSGNEITDCWDYLVRKTAEHGVSMDFPNKESLMEIQHEQRN